jgi:hypothetical protein
MSGGAPLSREANGVYLTVRRPLSPTKLRGPTRPTCATLLPPSLGLLPRHPPRLRGLRRLPRKGRAFALRGRRTRRARGPSPVARSATPGLRRLPGHADKPGPSPATAHPLCWFAASAPLLAGPAASPATAAATRTRGTAAARSRSRTTRAPPRTPAPHTPQACTPPAPARAAPHTHTPHQAAFEWSANETGATDLFLRTEQTSLRGRKGGGSRGLRHTSSMRETPPLRLSPSR